MANKKISGHKWRVRRENQASASISEYKATKIGASGDKRQQWAWRCVARRRRERQSEIMASAKGINIRTAKSMKDMVKIERKDNRHESNSG